MKIFSFLKKASKEQTPTAEVSPRSEHSGYAPYYYKELTPEEILEEIKKEEKFMSRIESGELVPGPIFVEPFDKDLESNMNSL